MATLTLDVDRNVVVGAEDYARRIRRTLPQLVEDFLLSISSMGSTTAHSYMLPVRVHDRATDDVDGDGAFERLMSFPRAKLPDNFDYKNELMEAIDERFDRVD